MKQEIKSALDGLSKLDLSKIPYDDCKKLIGQLGKFGCILVTLHKGKVLMRARPNFGDEHFISKCQLTYKPQQFNKTYQRASTPHRTMFYASMVPEKLNPGELQNIRVIGAFESLPWLRQKDKKGYQRISFGKWVVTKDIRLIAIVQHDDFVKQSSYTTELNEAFKKFTSEVPSDVQEETIAIADFFAKEFAKSATDEHYEYLISAIFSETIVDHGLDGVLYPSVRVGGQGFNVAIKPETADSNLDLVVAGECSMYKHYEQTVVDNDTAIELKPNQTNFEMVPVDPKYRAGQEECLKMIGLKSIDDLK